MEYEYLMTIGQDSHRFLDGVSDDPDNYVMLGGVKVPHNRCFSANSDGDVILHAVTNAITGYTGVLILGGIADELCLNQGIKDSRVYLKRALEDMGDARITHLSITVECLRPKLKASLQAIKESLGELLNLDPSRVGITATTGEGLTEFGKGEGVQVFACMTIRKPL